MVRTSLIILFALAAPATSCLALEASDTMSAWSGASAEAKRKLVTDLLKANGGGSADVIRCLDTAAHIPGHADLPIAVIVKACATNPGEPV